MRRRSAPMRRRLLWVATASLFVCFGGWGALTLAESPSPTGEPAPARPVEAVAAALCGRDVKPSSLMAMAMALDSLTEGKLPPPWHKMKAKEVEVWLAVPWCPEATPEEITLVDRRLQALELLRTQIERAQITEAIAAVVARLPRWQPTLGEWPDSSRCRGCRALRAAEAEIAALVASPWPGAKKGEQDPLGERLAAAAEREPLISRLCAVKPPPRARLEIEERFLYYSWTVNGARLLQVGELFEQSSIAAGCSGQ